MLVLRSHLAGSSVRVSAATKMRALILLDALFLALNQRGYQIRFEPGDAGRTHELGVVAAGRCIGVSITERRIKTPQEGGAPERGGARTEPRKYVYRGSGRLTLRLRAAYGVLPRDTWSDGEKQRLEDRLGEVVADIDLALIEIQRRSAEAEVRHRTEEEQQRHRARAETQARYHQVLLNDLRATASRWAEAQTVRLFLRAVSEAVPEHERSAGFAAWLTWANEHADEIDPLHIPERLAKRLEPALPGEKGM
jgi:hypothetical protein